MTTVEDGRAVNAADKAGKQHSGREDAPILTVLLPIRMVLSRLS